MKISVIIPVYNVEKYIGKCLDSIIANDHKNLEIICVNDGSTDCSLEILYEYEKQDNRIIVIDIKNGGVSNARNIAIEKASGDYICFVDADDCLHSRFFSTLLCSSMANNVDIVFCQWREFDSESYPEFNYLTNVVERKLPMKKIYELNRFIYCWGALYKKTSISGIKFPTELKIGEDNVFVKEVMWKSRDKYAVVIDNRLYFYRQREDSAIHFKTQSEFYNKEAKIVLFLKKSEKTDNQDDRDFWLRNGLELALGYRYNAYLSKNKEYYKKFNFLSKQSLRTMNYYAAFSKKDRVKYFVFGMFPVMYRIVVKKKK